MMRYIRLKGVKNITFDLKTETYYYEQQIDKRKRQWSTGVKGQIELEKQPDGRTIGIAKKGLGIARNAIRKMQQQLSYNKIGRPTFSQALDLALEVQSVKSKRTQIIALDGDKNLRPFFTKECPYLDRFVENYESLWAQYVTYQKKLKPQRKLTHDRRHLILVLRRAKKKGWIGQDFIKSDFALNETTEPVGRALDDSEVQLLLDAALEMRNEKIHLQILLAATMGLRKGEIMSLKIENVDLRRREMDLDPDKLKIRRKRKMEIPIPNDVFELLRARIEEIQALQPKDSAGYIFPMVDTKKKLRPVEWSEHQTDLARTFDRVKKNASVRCRFHDLRHTAITNMVIARIPVTNISKICGVSIDLINRVYDHVNQSVKDEIKDIFNNRYTKEK